MIPYLVRPSRIKELAGLAESWPAVVLDCETTGLDTYLGDRLLGFAIGNLRPGEGDPAYYYIPLTHNHPDDDPDYNATIRDLEPLRSILEGKPLVGYNLKFDLHVLAAVLKILFGELSLYDVLPLTRITSVEDRPFLDLETVAARELGYTYKSRAAGHQSQYGKNVFTCSEIGNKCCEDLYCTARLYHHWVDGDTPKSLLRLFRREVRLTRILYGMERRGIRYDPKALKDLDRLLTKKTAELLAQLRKDTKLPELNPRSSPQVEALMEQLGINPLEYNPPKKDGTVSPKWAREQLLEVDHPTALGVAQYRALGHLDSNFVAHLKRHVEHKQKAMRFTYQNWGTVSGRLSASRVQAMAKGWLQLGEMGEGGEALKWSEEGPDKTIAVRTLFVPRPGYFFFEADYSQIEMFIAGWYMAQVGDSTLLDLCRSEDVHAATAALVWGSESSEHRKRAKWFNFGLLYGLGDEGMAKKLKCSKAQATKYRGDYFRKIGPGYFTCLRDIKWRLRNNGYEENVFGRRYYASEEIAYIIWNYKVQGSAGDFVKFRQEAIEMLCRELDIHPIFTTHDDILLEVPNDLMDSHHLRRLIDILEDGSEPFGMRFPLKTKIARTNLAEMEAYRVPSAV